VEFGALFVSRPAIRCYPSRLRSKFHRSEADDDLIGHTTRNTNEHTSAHEFSFQLGLNWDDCWDELKGLLGAERWVKRRLISVKQLCDTPKEEAILILKHFLPFRNPILRIFVIWSEPLL
jgi:hypothetical protein